MSVKLLKNKEIGTIGMYNLSTKTYKDNLVKCKKVSFDCMKGYCKNNSHNGTMSEEELDYKTKKYLKVVKTNIIDLAYNNQEKFEYFITLTFSDKEIGEKYSHENCIKLLSKWINNQKHQNPKMSYILVPEFHKSGRLHFHGLVGNVPNWKFSKGINAKTGKPIRINGCYIYNLDNYKLGYTTISKIKDKEKVTNYISKYATKELITLKSKKRYWYSRNLEKPKIDYDYIEINLKDYLKEKDVKYYDVFQTDNREIEIGNYQLPIIDIMLTSILKIIK